MSDRELGRLYTGKSDYWNVRLIHSMLLCKSCERWEWEQQLRELIVEMTK